MFDEEDKSFNTYKGLQKPLVFKGFKGKFIYIGFACIIGGLIFSIIMSTLISFLAGMMTLVIILFVGLAVTSIMQNRGLHKKRKDKGVFIITNTINRNNKK